MFAIIGGSGIVGTALMPTVRREIARTPYGAASSPLYFGTIAGQEVVFIARHGPGHVHPPHQVNYRANLWALRDAGTTRIISLAAVGGIAANCNPGTLVVPDQIIDYTHGREHTYFDGGDRQVRHVDFTQPYDAALRALLMRASASAGEAFVDRGVYAATQGPRLETAAEIARLSRDGATIVGMTGMPEASLARELGVAYAHLCAVANWAAGCGDSATAVSQEAMETTMQKLVPRLANIVTAAVGGSK